MAAVLRYVSGNVTRTQPIMQINTAPWPARAGKANGLDKGPFPVSTGAMLARNSTHAHAVEAPEGRKSLKLPLPGAGATVFG